MNDLSQNFQNATVTVFLGAAISSLVRVAYGPGYGGSGTLTSFQVSTGQTRRFYRVLLLP